MRNGFAIGQPSSPCSRSPRPLRDCLPGPLGSPLRRLANAKADGPDPLWDVPVNAQALRLRAHVDGDALRRAHGIVHRGETYFVDVPRTEQPLLLNDLAAGARLFLLPGLPVLDRQSADWVLRTTRPPTPEQGGTIRLSPTLFLVRRR